LHGGHGFDPNQPRIPPGHSDGGRWTDKPGGGAPSAPRRDVTVDRTGKETWNSFANAYRPDGTLAEQRVFNRDGSRIVSEFNEPGSPGDWDVRHTVVMADGRKVTFETTGNIQRIYDGDGRLVSASVWTKDGPQSLSDQVAFSRGRAVRDFITRYGPVVRDAVVAAASALYTWLSSRNEPNHTAALSLPATEYQLGSSGKLERTWVEQLTDEQLKEVCRQYPKTQALTDQAADTTNRALYRTAAEYGTAVHAKLAQAIGKNDPNFRPEVSLLKTLDETGELPEKIPYGTKGSVRIDVLENTDTNRVCIYDIKTGKSGLTPSRIAELARTVYLRYPKARSFLVIEVRPQRGAAEGR
jgi:hypothetical protein